MKRSKKFLAMLLCLGMVGTAFQPAGALAAEPQKNEAQNQEDQKNEAAKLSADAKIPTLKLSFGEGQEMPVYDAGTEGTLEIKVKNNSDKNVKNVVVVPKNEKNWPFDTGNMNSTVKLEDIKAGEEKPLTYSVKVPEDTKGAKYELKFTITYEDEEGTAYTASPNVFIRINEKKAPEPEPQPQPQPEPQPEVPTDPGQGDMGGIDFGGGVSNGDVSGGEGSNSVPRVIVTGFSTEPAVVKAGTDFKLIIHLKNTSKETAVQNMLFDLEAPTEGDANTASPAFLPASGSNSIYLDKIKANGTQDISIVLNAKADLVQKPYSINIGMKYENSDAAQFEASASVSIPIKQDARFEFSEFQLTSDSIEVGSEVNVMCNLYNLGRTKLYNAKVNFEGEGVEAPEQFLGNVEPGATAAVDSMLTGTAPTTGDGTVKMIMSYEDEEGVQTTFEKTFTVFVTEPMMEDVGMMEMPEEMTEEKKFPVVPFVIGGAVVVGIVAVIIVKKKKKRRQEEEEAELVDEFDRLTEDERQ